jgi:hypothetical protein
MPIDTATRRIATSRGREVTNAVYQSARVTSTSARNDPARLFPGVVEVMAHHDRWADLCRASPALTQPPEVAVTSVSIHASLARTGVQDPSRMVWDSPRGVRVTSKRERTPSIWWNARSSLQSRKSTPFVTQPRPKSVPRSCSLWRYNQMPRIMHPPVANLIKAW